MKFRHVCATYGPRSNGRSKSVQFPAVFKTSLAVPQLSLMESPELTLTSSY